MPLLFSYSVRAVANSEPGLKRGIQTKDPEGDLFVFRVGGKGSVVSRRGVNGIASEAANKGHNAGVEGRAQGRLEERAGSARNRRSYGLDRERAEA